MGMVKAGEFLQQSYVAVGGSDIHVDLLLFSREKFIQDYHLESAKHRWEWSKPAYSSAKQCGRDPITLSKLKDLRTSL